MAIKFIITMTLAFMALHAFCQEFPRKDFNLNIYLEELFAVPDEDLNYEELYESFFLLYQNPLNLNKITKNELQSLFILSEAQISSFFSYMEENGTLISIYELQAIPGFDLPIIYKLMPFVTIRDPGLQYDPKPLLQRILNEKNNMLIVRYDRTLEEKRGYNIADTNEAGTARSRYLGGPHKIYSRFRVSHSKDFSLGFTMEKDAGERFYFDRANKAYGMDFYSFHFLVQQKGRLKSLALGDFQLQIGQSLLLGAGFVVGKGSETVNTVRRSTLGIRPYTSVVESGFFRGAAATYEMGKFFITSFYSNKQQDGNVQQLDSLVEQQELQASSIYVSGLHRTPREIATKNQINEQVTGGNVQYRSSDRKFEAGATIIATQYDVRLQRPSRNYNQFEFQGNSNYNYGLNYSYNWQNFNFFGEGAVSKSGGKGFISGFVSSLTPKVEVSMLMRHFDRNFHSFYGRAFGENTRNINERGAYMGIKIFPFPKVAFTAFYDQFYFPWLKFRIDAPSDGYEYLMRLNYSPSKKILLYLQFREKSRGINVAGINLNEVHQGARRNFIVNLDYTATPIFHFRSRLQASTYSLKNTTTSGLAMVQDVNIHYKKFTISSRVALFDTDDFQNRQYVYEKDVLYAFSIPAYNGLGTRTYIMVQYKANSHLQVWCRYSRTIFHDRFLIGSGLEEIEGNKRSDIKIQLMYRI
ncbi:MAG: helix-hairpin-helix domain-containing protein [Bacteroidota bacterium]|nr:helix-hairpin-helix domain-containing protein [Bacteroidota bacterium]